jgi:hypothetical protein
MYRRIVHTLIGALVGYFVGAVVGMMLFAWLNGFRSVAIVEEPNRNRWAFVAAAGAAVIGGLIAWWRSYGDEPAPRSPAAADDGSDPGPDAGAGAEGGAGPDAATAAVDDPVAEAGTRPPDGPVADGTADGGSAAP